MTHYYSEHLAGERLKQVYEIASPRVRRYLEAEIEHVRGRLRPEDTVLELGCGYGRVALRLAPGVRCVLGIDNARESLLLACHIAGTGARCLFACMDAVRLGLADNTFDAVVCVQNGICALGVDPPGLLREALRVARPGGRLLFSTYADRFWPERLAWFEAQADAGLLGAVDRAASRDGVIVCHDGFRAGRMTPGDLQALARDLGVEGQVTEVDGSSVFCELVKRGGP